MTALDDALSLSLSCTPAAPAPACIPDGHRVELARSLAGASEAMHGAILWRRVDGVDVAAPPDPASIFVNGEAVASL